MPFVLLELCVSLIRLLKKLIAKIAVQDRDLANQIRRAAGSVPLNVSEARRRNGRDRLHLFRVALGSAAEALALLDRIRAMTWRAARAG